MDDRFEVPQEDNPFRSSVDSAEDSESASSINPVGPKFDPFHTIWRSPRETIRQIVSTDPELHVTLLICLAGISESLDRASTRNAGDQLSLGAILAFACILGPLGGLFGVWMYSHLIRFSGEWIGGRGGYDEIKAAIAWASVPNVAGLVIWVALLLLLGREMFTEETPSLDGQTTSVIVFLILVLAQVALGIWSVVLLCNTIAEVQGYQSAWRGFGNVILAGLLLVVPLLILAVLFVFLIAA